jgi:hypothetical protein
MRSVHALHALFTGAHLNRFIGAYWQVNHVLAALMVAAGLAAALLGHRMLRIVLAGLAFLVGAAGAMYPIDAIFGDMLCGPSAHTARSTVCELARHVQFTH